MTRRRLKKPVIISIIILAILLFLFTLSIAYYNYSLSKVNDNKSLKEIIVSDGDSINNIIETLKKEQLIRSKFAVKLYIRLNGINNLQAGTYDLSSSYSSKKIIKIISSGKISTKNEINITFKEGENIREFAKVISENTINTEKDVFNLLKDKTYINELINKYWFITDEIKNTKLYYPLEGYLFPNTYRFKNNKVTVKEIFEKLLDQMNSELTPYKSEIEKKKFTVHEFLTMASIVENEGVNDNDRPKIASVFYNRLDNGMAFQSCATACYAAKYDGACTPDNVNTTLNSPYNTYMVNMVGLPVGPISNPGGSSIKAALNPEVTDYLFFLADKNKKTYFSKTITEHEQKIQQLIKAGLWFN